MIKKRAVDRWSGWVACRVSTAKKLHGTLSADLSVFPSTQPHLSDNFHNTAPALSHHSSVSYPLTVLSKYATLRCHYHDSVGLSLIREGIVDRWCDGSKVLGLGGWILRFPVRWNEPLGLATNETNRTIDCYCIIQRKTILVDLSEKWC